MATLTVTDKLPLITVQSPAQVEPVIIGQTENLPIFSVKATTNHPDEKLTYQWFFLKENDPSQSGTKINGATSSSYQTKADDVKTVGNIYFYVEIKGSINGFNLEIKYSDSNLLKVDELPEILVFPGSSTTATVVIGQTQNLPTFSIEATTTSKLEEKLTYQWYFNTTNSTTNGTPIQGATNDSYTIKQNEIGSTATRKYYYVKINGSVNGVSLIPIDSEVRTLIINNA